MFRGGIRNPCLVTVFWKTILSIFGRLGMIAFLAVVTIGCGRNEPEPKTTGAREVTETDRAVVTAFVDKKRLSIAESMTLKLQLDVPEDYQPTFPEPETIGEFKVARTVSRDPVLIDGGKLRFVRTYELEPFLSGEYRIPAMEIVFQKKNAADTPQETIQNKPFSVTVTSVIGDGSEELKDVAGPVKGPTETYAWILYAVIGLIIF
ncbi:hypothetical protein BVX99_00090, partial [bacterium F16]